MARKLDGGEPESDHSPTTTDKSQDDDTRGGSFLARREYVQLSMAAVAATAGLASTAGTVSAGEGEERDGIQFDRVMDAVDDLGMDPTGGESIAPKARDIPADTLVQFPNGEYLVDDRIELSECGNVGLEATGDATFKIAAEFTDRAFDVCESTSVYYAGFTHDRTAGAVNHRWDTTDRLELRNVALTGDTVSAESVETLDASTDEDAYETIVLDPGEQQTYTLSDGEIFENVLIDQTADGAMFVILTESGANDWTIRNVGWKGVAPTGSSSRNHTFLINVRGDGVIENIFVDQRDHSGSGPGSDVGGIWTYSDSHNGHVECRHNFIAGCGNNGCYDSGDGWSHQPGTGTVGHEYCYHRDNTPSNFRPGMPGSYIRNSVSIANDPDGKRGGYPATGSQLTRACWAWHHTDMEMENCAIWWDPDDVSPSTPFWATHRSGSAGSTCELTLIDCDINASWEDAGNPLATSGGEVFFQNLGTNPSVEVLGEGVPLTPEMAAGGERALPPEIGSAPGGGHGESEGTNPSPPDDGDDDEDDDDNGDEENLFTFDHAEGVHSELPRELVIEHTEPGATVEYELEVDGELEVGEFDFGASVDDSVATGSVGPTRGLDNLYFDGEITRFEGENLDHVRVLIADPETRTVLGEYDPEDFPTNVNRFTYGFARGVHTDLPLELVIEHVDPGHRVEYELEVDGELEVGEFDYPGSVNGSVGSGGLGPECGLDNFYLNGEITRLEGENLDAVRVYLADPQTRTVIEELDPASFPGDEDEDPERTIRIVGRGETSNYEFTTSGDLSDDPSVEFDASGNISGGNAEGSVTDGEHGYRFTGDLVDVQHDGNADMFVNGNPVADGNGDLDSLIRIDGSITDGVARYRLKVNGDLEYSETDSGGDAGRWDNLTDHLTDDTVTGIVHQRVDAYRFSGDIVYLDVYGAAEIEIDDIA